MVFLKIVFLSLLLLILAFAGLGIKLLFDKNAKFTGGGCSSCTCDSSEEKNC
jgi:hypothetical protein